MGDIQQFHDESVENAVRSVQNGKPGAFETVVRAFEGSLRAWLSIQSPPGIDSDEIAQRSFVEAYRRVNDYQLGTNFKAWLFAIARFQLKTEVTRLRRLADYHARYVPEFIDRELERRADSDPGEESEKLSQLKNCVESLGDHLRRFVEWRYRDEITLEEMAQRSERSVSAVKKQLWKIRRKLQECVERGAAKAEKSPVNYPPAEGVA